MTLKEEVGSEDPGKMQSDWRATLDTGETISAVHQEFARSESLLRRLGMLVRAEFDTWAAKELDISAPDFAVQAAACAGAKKALQVVYRLINADPTL